MSIQRKSPYRHAVSSHYREGKYIDRYERGKGNKPNNPGRSINKLSPKNGFNVTLYYLEGQETHPVKAGNYTEAVMSGFDQAEGEEMPQHVRVRRQKN